MNLILLSFRGAFSFFVAPLVVFLATIKSLVASVEDEPYIIDTYYVDISPLSDMYDVSGFAVLFTKQESEIDAESTSVYLGYAGKVENIENNLSYASCTAVYGCGIYVHAGTSCLNIATQGDPYYNSATIDEDPWIDARYFTNDDGVSSSFSSVVDIGTADIEGRPFIVHSKNGTRIGCGIIEKVPDQGLLSTYTNELAGSGVTGQVSIHTLGEGIVCYFGLATSLERGLVSYLYPDTSLYGNDCNFTNGCGVSIHNGTSCTDSTTQGGHYYGSDVAIDPWLYTMYYSTDGFGEGYFTGCVDTGITDDSMLNDRPFIVHSNNGTRVSCGMLQVAAGVSPIAPTPGTITAPTPVMPNAPTPTIPSTSHATTILVTTNIGLILTFVLSGMQF